MNDVSAKSRSLVVVQTPHGRGAVATLSVTGTSAAQRVDRFFQPLALGRKLSRFELGRIVFGRWGSDPGEDIVACRIADDAIELHCHGGQVAADQIQRDLMTAGCEIRDWRLTDYSTLHRIRGEAAQALAEARTLRTASILLDQYQGAWQAEIALLHSLAARSAFADLRRKLETLLGWADVGLHLTQPWRVVLAGRPNVGKSSLINVIVGYQRAIVFDQPGTTRDIVTAQAALNGWPVELSDTAGLHRSADALEAAGIERSRRQIAAADCLLLVFDASKSWSQEDEMLMAEHPQAIVVHNKADCRLNDTRPGGLSTSTITGQGLKKLLDRLASTLVPVSPPPGSALPFTRRQIELLQSALQATAAGNAHAVSRILARLDGADRPAEQ